MTEKHVPRPGDEDFDPEVDRYPSIHGVIDQVLGEDHFPDGPIERLEITCQASGDANWRAWPARAEEPEGGYFPPGG